MTVRPLEPATVNASEVTDEVDLLLTDAEGPWGETFRQVQAIYKVGVEPQPGGGSRSRSRPGAALRRGPHTLAGGRLRPDAPAEAVAGRAGGSRSCESRRRSSWARC